MKFVLLRWEPIEPDPVNAGVGRDMHSNNLRIFVAACCGLILFAEVGLADDQQPPLEITITDPLPERFDETLPGLISEIDAKSNRESGFIRTDSILERLPNVTWSAGTSRPRFLFIRGIGDLDQYAGSGLPAVTILSDGLNLSGLGQGLSLFDARLTRIERGPTGFFGGPSSLAGLVSFESGVLDFDPLTSDSTILESSFGTGGVRTIAARTAFGEADNFGTITAERAHQDGFLRNAYLGRADTNHLDTATVKGSYTNKWGAGNSLTLNAITRQNDDGYDAFTIDNTRTVRSDKPGADDLGLLGGAARSTMFIDPDLRLDAEVSSLRAESTYSYDGDWGNDEFWFPYVPYDYFSITDRDRHLSSASGKLTFGSEETFMAQVGLFGQWLSESTSQLDFAGNDPYRSLDSDFDDDRYAVHGAVSYRIIPSVRTWFATRIEQQRVSLDSDQQSESETSTAPLFQLGIEHFTSPQTSVFLKGSRGWRGGGFNVGAAIPQERVSYDPEYLTEISMGVKHEFQNSDDFIELSVFRAYRYDQQVRLELQTDPTDPLSFVYITDNAARGDTLGLEATSAIHLSKQLSLSPSLALLDSSFSDFDGGREELQHRDTALSPNWRVNLDARYQITSRWFTKLGIVSTDRYYFDDANDAQSASITLLNGSFGYEAGPWSIVFWGQNLLDKRYPVRGFFFGNEPPDFTPKRYIQRGVPLSGGVTVSYSF